MPLTDDSSVSIVWSRLPKDLQRLSPREQLGAYTAAAGQRLATCPWVGCVAPLDADGRFVECAISLVAGVSFVGEVQSRFRQVALELRNACTSAELEWILADQTRRGNDPASFSADSGLLRILVPQRLEDECTRGLRALFEAVPQVVEESDGE